jgi:hypothetical protein
MAKYSIIIVLCSILVAEAIQNKGEIANFPSQKSEFLRK